MLSSDKEENVSCIGKDKKISKIAPRQVTPGGGSKLKIITWRRERDKQRGEAGSSQYSPFPTKEKVAHQWDLHNEHTNTQSSLGNMETAKMIGK